MKKSNVIKYQFRGKLDINLLAENMKRDKTPIVIVMPESPYCANIYILKSFRANYRGVNLQLSSRKFFMVCDESVFEHNLLYASGLIPKKNINKYLPNIKAIMKSHEDACLPVIKVLAVETTAGWSE